MPGSSLILGPEQQQGFADTAGTEFEGAVIDAFARQAADTAEIVQQVAPGGSGTLADHAASADDFLHGGGFASGVGDAVWLYGALGDAWGQAGLLLKELWRYGGSTYEGGVRLYSSFYFQTFEMRVDDTDPIDVPFLNNANPWANADGESDLDMLIRLYPAYTWLSDAFVPHRVGAVIETVGGVHGLWVYDPPGPSLSDIRDLFMYTPTSGPPKRSLIEDMQNLIACVPVTFNSPP